MKAKKLTLSLEPRLSELESLRRALLDFGERHGLDKKCILETNLALDELFTNIVSYGCCEGARQQIRISLVCEPESMTITVQDNGPAFNPIEAEPPDTDCGIERRRVGGIGIHLVKNMMDDLAYQRAGDRNILKMKKRIHPGNSPENDPENGKA